MPKVRVLVQMAPVSPLLSSVTAMQVGYNFNKSMKIDCHCLSFKTAMMEVMKVGAIRRTIPMLLLSVTMPM